jgi:hypothetical protein
MYQIIREQIRPSIDVDFFSIAKHAPEVVKYWDDTIVKTRKHLGSTHTLSEDGLTMTTVMIYASKDAWYDMTSDQYLNDTLFVIQRAYNKNNNIIRTFKSATEI